MVKLEDYSLFHDIEGEALRAHNRGATLYNILTAHKQRSNVNAVGVKAMIEYVQEIPLEERALALQKLEEILEKE